MSRWIALCVLVALGSIGGPPPATAMVQGEASATVTAVDVEPGHGCADSLVTYTVSLPPEATTWILTVRGIAEGASTSFFYADSASGDPLSGQGAMEVCGQEGGPREDRTLTWTIDWTYVDQGDRIHASDSGTGGAFVVNGVVPPSPWACPECEATTTVDLRVARKLDKVWVLKSTLVWRKGSDRTGIADANLHLVGPKRSTFTVINARTNARGVATYRVKIPRTPVRLHVSFAGGKAYWPDRGTIYMVRTRSASVRVGRSL